MKSRKGMKNSWLLGLSTSVFLTDDDRGTLEKQKHLQIGDLQEQADR
jgi:hypothetical protein